MNRMDFRLPGGVKGDPAVDAWMKERTGELGSIAQEWFHVMRERGYDVRELMTTAVRSHAWKMRHSVTSMHSKLM